MPIEPFVVTPEDYAKGLSVVGEQIVVLASGRRTGGYEVFLQTGPEGVGPPPHRHDWDETFVVTKGEVHFGYDDKELTAKAGALVHLPAGTTHWFRLGKGGAEMISMTSRLGASDFFTEVDAKVDPTAPDFEGLAAVAGGHGITIGG